MFCQKALPIIDFFLIIIPKYLTLIHKNRLSISYFIFSSKAECTQFAVNLTNGKSKHITGHKVSQSPVSMKKPREINAAKRDERSENIEDEHAEAFNNISKKSLMKWNRNMQDNIYRHEF